MQSTKTQIILEIRLRAINLIHVNCANKGYCEKYSSRNGRISPLALGRLAWLGFCVLFCGVPGLTWARAEEPEGASGGPVVQDFTAAAPSSEPDQQAGQQADRQIPGSISGTVL